MEPTNPKPSAIRSVLQRWAEDGVGIMVAILFFILVGIIAVVAAASSNKPWDTVIAAIGMGSQAFFAYVVYRLGKNQYAFTQLVANRQHKIDMYPLRKKVYDFLEGAEGLLIPKRPITFDDGEAFRLCHLEIAAVFSDEADALAFELYEAVQYAERLFSKAQHEFDEGGSIIEVDKSEARDKAYASLDDVINVYTDLQNMLNDEMRIR